MDALLTMIVVWLTANFDLPAAATRPKIEYRTAIEIALIRYEANTPEKRRALIASYENAPQNNRREVVAIYDLMSRTIFLPHGWTGTTPAELSVLVHEMVHHMQKTAGFSYECPAAREKLAYDAQEKWLGLFGHSLAIDFEIDPFTLLVSTSCIH